MSILLFLIGITSSLWAPSEDNRPPSLFSKRAAPISSWTSIQDDSASYRTVPLKDGGQKNTKAWKKREKKEKKGITGTIRNLGKKVKSTLGFGKSKNTKRPGILRKDGEDLDILNDLDMDIFQQNTGDVLDVLDGVNRDNDLDSLDDGPNSLITSRGVMNLGPEDNTINNFDTNFEDEDKNQDDDAKSGDEVDSDRTHVNASVIILNARGDKAMLNNNLPKDKEKEQPTPPSLIPERNEDEKRKNSLLSTDSGMSFDREEEEQKEKKKQSTPPSSTSNTDEEDEDEDEKKTSTPSSSTSSTDEDENKQDSIRASRKIHFKTRKEKSEETFIPGMKLSDERIDIILEKLVPSRESESKLERRGGQYIKNRKPSRINLQEGERSNMNPNQEREKEDEITLVYVQRTVQNLASLFDIINLTTKAINRTETNRPLQRVGATREKRSPLVNSEIKIFKERGYIERIVDTKLRERCDTTFIKLVDDLEFGEDEFGKFTDRPTLTHYLEKAEIYMDKLRKKRTKGSKPTREEELILKRMRKASTWLNHEDTNLKKSERAEQAYLFAKDRLKMFKKNIENGVVLEDKKLLELTCQGTEVILIRKKNVTR